MTLGALKADPDYRYVHRSVRKGYEPRHSSGRVEPYSGPLGEGYTVTLHCPTYRGRVYVDYYVRVIYAESPQ